MANQIKDYLRLRARAAKWLLENKDRAAWWDWPVLTNSNPDTTTPAIPDVIAFNIFTDLAERKLLVPHTIDSADAQGSKRGVYKLNVGNQAAWHEVSNPPGWFMRSMNWIFRKWAWLFGIIVTVVVTTLVKAYFDGTWPF